MTEKQRIHPDGSRLHHFGKTALSTKAIASLVSTLIVELVLGAEDFIAGIKNSNWIVCAAIAVCTIASLALVFKAICMLQDTRLWIVIQENTPDAAKAWIKKQHFHAFLLLFLGATVASAPQWLQPVVFNCFPGISLVT
jgi:hypothetical protein